MKTLFWLIVGLIIVATILLFGNALRCATKRGVAACPQACNSVPIVCREELNGQDCQELLNCQSPSLPQYRELFNAYVGELKNNARGL